MARCVELSSLLPNNTSFDTDFICAANMNLRTARALTKALRSDDVAQFSEIVDDDAWAYEPACSGKELLIRAFREDSKRIAIHLLDSGCPAAEGLLHLCLAKIGWDEVTTRLLNLGARVTHVDEHGNTALHLAFLQSASNVVIDMMIEKYLLESQSNVANVDGLTFLHVLCTRTRIDVLQRVMGFDGIDVNVQVAGNSTSLYAGYTPLHFAVENGRIGIAVVLLEHKASINIQDKSGSTPLHLALKYRDIGMINLLLAHDSETTDVINSSGLSHFMAACAGSNPSVVRRILIRHQFSKSMLDQQVDDHYSFGGYAPIHWASEYGRLKTVKLLLQHDADCDLLTEKSFTPLKLARQGNFEEVARLLEQHRRRDEATRVGDGKAIGWKEGEEGARGRRTWSLMRCCCKFFISLFALFMVCVYYLMTYAMIRARSF